MRFLALAVVLLASGACGKHDDGIANVPLTTPWTGWALPELGHAKVMSSTAKQARLFFAGCEEPSSIFALYDSWVRRQGWTAELEPSATMHVGSTYDKADKHLRVDANNVRGGCQLSLELQ